jgi:hypothetical protein
LLHGEKNLNLKKNTKKMNTNDEKKKNNILKDKKRRISVFENTGNVITKFDVKSKEQEKRESDSNDKR